MKPRYVQPVMQRQAPLVFNNAARQAPEGTAGKEMLDELAKREVTIRRALVLMKFCPKCRVYKDTSEHFYPDDSRPDGWRGYCKSCKGFKQRVKSLIWGDK